MKKRKRGALYQKCIFIHSQYHNHFYPWIKIECYQLRKIKSKNSIILLYIINTNTLGNPNKSTLIYSHSNKGDLGIYFPFLIDISTQLKQNIISYDYTGYGSSEGEPSIKTIYSDIYQVMDFCINNLHISKQSIVLMGHASGAIPSIYIGSQGEYCSIREMILLSPFISDNYLYNGDTGKEKNIDNDMNFFDLATEVLCPVFIIHGKLDPIVNYKQSELLKDKLCCSVSSLLDNGHHFNLLLILEESAIISLINLLVL